jgi:hypothetical protein
MSWRRPPIASARSRPCEPQLLADLNREQRHAPRVLLGRLVLLREQACESANARAEEGLLLRDELLRAQVADERSRLRGAVEVGCDGRADEDDAHELEAVTHPPAEIHERKGIAGGSAAVSQAMPMTTNRSPARCVRRYVFSERRISSA